MLSSARDHPYRSMRQRVSRWVHGWVRRWVVGWVGRRREKAGKLYVSQTGAEQKGSPPPGKIFPTPIPGMVSPETRVRF